MTQQQTIPGPTGLPSWECDPTTGTTTQTGSAIAADMVVGTEAAPSVPAPGYVKIYSPDGQSLATLTGSKTSTIGTGTGTGTPDWFNVKSYGAKGDGTTDDTAAINRALAAANAQGGGTVYVPWGNYLVSSTLSIPPFVQLVGQTTVSLNLNALPGTVSRIIAAASWAPSSATGIISFLSKIPGGWSVGAQSSGLHSLYLDGSLNASANLNGIFYQGPVYDTHLEDVYIYAAPHNGIQAVTQTESGITPTFPYHQRWDRVTANLSANVGANLVNFTDSTFANCLLFASVSNNAALQNNSNCLFEACRFEWSSGGRGVDITGAASSVVFTGCETDQNNGEGLRIHSATGQSVQGGGIVWTGGKLHADGNGGVNNNGIVITGSTVPITITGVNVECGQNSASFFPANAISISSSSNVTVSGSTLQGATSAWNDGGSNSLITRSACLGATGNPNTQTFTALPNLQPGGNNTASGSNAITPTLANGTAAQLSDTTRDYTLYLQIGTAGSAFTLAMGPTSGVANTIATSTTPTAGEVFTVRVPAGWFVKWAGTSTTMASQLAVSC